MNNYFSYKIVEGLYLNVIELFTTFYFHKEKKCSEMNVIYCHSS